MIDTKTKMEMERITGKREGRKGIIGKESSGLKVDKVIWRRGKWKESGRGKAKERLMERERARSLGVGW